ncbi:MAG TPA: GNAT family N-acetyltransferase [Gaiellaceae bacterium]|nr:GNAT family N-acetyltransferase [Gaiellaceae bacterium]
MLSPVPRRVKLASAPTITRMDAGDWARVREIFEAGIASGQATLEDAAPNWDDWNAQHLADHRWVARHGEQVIGWSALSFPHRTASSGVAESSVYVDPAYHRQGAGRRLLEHLIESSERAGLWTLEARILQTNMPSLGLHMKLGFRVVGVRSRIGRLNGDWQDVILLERRSAMVGV